MFQVSQVDDVSIVTFGMKRATADIAHEFKDLINTLADEKGVRKILLDCSGVFFIDSFFLGAIVSGLKRVRANGGEIKIYNLDKNVYPVFKLMHLNEVFEIFSDRTEAILAFTQNSK